MRFHKFQMVGQPDSEGWVDLDRIHAVIADGNNPQRTICATPNGGVKVVMPVDAVLTLISPPAAPDRYEEELRDKPITELVNEGLLRAHAQHNPSTPGWVREALAREAAKSPNILNPELAQAQKLALRDPDPYKPQGNGDVLERAARLDELDRYEKELKLKFPYSDGSWAFTYVSRRRAELA